MIDKPVVPYISAFQLEFERFSMSDSEPAINKNKAHRKDKREYNAAHLLLFLNYLQSMGYR